MTTVLPKTRVRATRRKGISPARRTSIVSKKEQQEARRLLAAIENGSLDKFTWANSKELLQDIFISLKLFRLGLIDAEAARVYLGQLRNAAKILSLNLEFARVTGQIQKGQKTLQGFGIS